jgi:hypothetical protein
VNISLRSLRGYLTDHFGWKLLALAIAVLLWVIVGSEPDLSTFVTVPLEYRSLPEDLEISSNLIESVTLEVRGPSGELRSLADERRPVVILNMGGVRAGERTFAINDSNVELPRRVRLVRAVPSQVRFDFERRRVRTVPVRVRFANAPAEYEVARYSASPQELAIVGPENHVARMTVAVTDPIDLTGVIGTAEFRVNAFIDNPYVRFQSSPVVTVDVIMRKK